MLNKHFNWVEADLLIAHCVSCASDYFPDKITYTLAGHGRQQRLENDAQFLRVSKHGIWMDRSIAIAQENALLRFRAGWSNFADWLSDTIGKKPRITNRQSQRLFLEHFACRLLVAHNKVEHFQCPALCSSDVFAKHLRDIVGCDGGVLATAMTHGCVDCTHSKRYKMDLEQEGLIIQETADGIADMVDIQVSQNLLSTCSILDYTTCRMNRPIMMMDRLFCCLLGYQNTHHSRNHLKRVNLADMSVLLLWTVKPSHIV